MFYCYGGLEAGAGLWAASLLVSTRGVSLARAGAAVALYWGALCAGRFVIGAFSDGLGPARVLRVTVWIALAAVIALALPGTPAWFVSAALAALGFAVQANDPPRDPALHTRAPPGSRTARSHDAMIFRFLVCPRHVPALREEPAELPLRAATATERRQVHARSLNFSGQWRAATGVSCNGIDRQRM
jgi:MFS family permease